MTISQLNYETDYLFNIVARDKINLMINTLNSGIPINSVVVVNSPEDFAGAIDPSKVYIVDGIVDFTGSGISIEVPSTGIQLLGYGFNVSGLKCDDDNFTLFTSPVGGSGDILINDLFIEVTGTNSKVYDIFDATGFNAIELNIVNYINCSSLGVIDNYRQGLENGTGRFRGKPTLELKGTWAGGYRDTTTITRSLDPTMTTPLFKAGTGFVMQSRFLTDMNADLPAGVAIADFSPSNFPNASTVQFRGAILATDGVFSTSNDLMPNLSAGSLAAFYKDNTGLENTYVGAKAVVDTEVVTNITTQDVYVPLLANWIVSELQHFDSPASGQLRHLGNTPINYQLVADFSIAGFANEVIEIDLIKYDASTGQTSPIAHQQREVNNFVGARDVAFYSFTINFTLEQNDYVFFNVANESSNRDVTLIKDSFMFVSER